MSFSHPTRSAARVLAGCLLLLTARATAQNPAPRADPSDFGLEIPENAEPKPAADRRVMVNSPAGELVVGKVHVEVGDRLIVILPNGRLLSVLARDATITDRPFEPATKAAIKTELVKEKFKGFKTRETKRYLYVYNTSEPFTKATSTILETMYPALYKYCEREKLPVHDPEMPMVVIMFRTEDEFAKYMQMPEGVVAYYNGVTNYVVMYEQSRLADIAPELAIKQSISTIAHEGVHQILHNIGVQQRLSRWPMWISEGLPEYFAPTTVGKRVRWKGLGKTNDLRMYSLIETLKEKSSFTGELVKATVEAEELDADGYAASWALTFYLSANKKKELFAYLRDISQLGPLVPPSAETAALFAKHFGDDYRAIENGLVKKLQKLPYEDPIANQTHYVATITAGGFARVLVSTSPMLIKKAMAEFPGARCSVQAYPNRDAAEQAYNSIGVR